VFVVVTELVLFSAADWFIRRSVGWKDKESECTATTDSNSYLRLNRSHGDIAIETMDLALLLNAFKESDPYFHCYVI